jgi:D-glycero-D-manno-heptose 1,7-bisphosphate phosphatase
MLSSQRCKKAVSVVDMVNKLIILDRDGVINFDSDAFIKSPDEWIPIPGSLRAIANLKVAGWTVAVATNQSGIARGLFDEQRLTAIHKKMREGLAELNADIDYLVWCPHGPSDRCACRKPKPGMYHHIAQYFDCTLMNVPVIGDSKRDLEAAVSVGARPILVTTGKGQKTLEAGKLPIGTEVFADLSSAAIAVVAAEFEHWRTKS